MLSTGLLLDINFVFVDTLVGCPIDTLVRAHRVLGRCRQEHHVLSKLLDRHAVLRLFTYSIVVFLIEEGALRLFSTITVSKLTQILENTEYFPLGVILSFDKGRQVLDEILRAWAILQQVVQVRAFHGGGDRLSDTAQTFFGLLRGNRSLIRANGVQEEGKSA